MDWILSAKDGREEFDFPFQKLNVASYDGCVPSNKKIIYVVHALWMCPLQLPQPAATRWWFKSSKKKMVECETHIGGGCLDQDLRRVRLPDSTAAEMRSR
jgi:hypothetical protein